MVLSNRSKISCIVSDVRSLNQQWLTKLYRTGFPSCLSWITPLPAVVFSGTPSPNTHQEDNTIIKRNMWGSAQTLPSVCTYTRTGQVGPFSNACLDVGLFRVGYGWVSCWALIRLQQPKHVPDNPKHTCRWETRWLSGRPHLLQSPQLLIFIIIYVHWEVSCWFLSSLIEI